MFGVCDMHLVPAACLGFGARRVLKAPVPQSLHVLCLPCALSQVGTCLAVSTQGQCRGPCIVLGGQMCAVPMVYSAQGPLPSDHLQLPTHLADQSVHHISTSHQGAGVISGSQPLCPAAWGGQAGCPHHICHQWSYGIKAEVLITQMLENGGVMVPMVTLTLPLARGTWLCTRRTAMGTMQLSYGCLGSHNSQPPDLGAFKTSALLLC